MDSMQQTTDRQIDRQTDSMQILLRRADKVLEVAHRVCCHETNFHSRLSKRRFGKKERASRNAARSHHTYARAAISSSIHSASVSNDGKSTTAEVSSLSKNMID
jgi:hypothetical protein